MVPPPLPAVRRRSSPPGGGVRDSVVMAALGSPPPPPPVEAIFGEMAEGPQLEGAGPGQAWLDAHGGALGHFVAGSWLRPPGGKSLECREAATGRLMATVPRGGPEEVAAAVGAAVGAAPAWGALGACERARRLERLADLLERGGAAVAAVGAMGTGRPLALTRGPDLGLGLRLLRAPAAGARLGPPGMEEWGPLGAVALVVGAPCSLPGLLWKLGPLLAMGNTAVVLVLPPPEAALAPLLLAELGGGAGGPLPPGVLNVVTAPPTPLGGLLGTPPRVAAVTCLGDVPELPRPLPGGAPFFGGGAQARGGRVVAIVLDSADLDSAAAAIGGGVGAPPALFPWGGCVVLAQEGVAAALGRRLRGRLGGLRLGDPLDAGTQVGALPPGAPPPEELVGAAREEGAEIFQAPQPLPPGGRFYPPTLITGVAPTSRCLREPAWGPLVVLVPVRSPAEAVAVASGLPRVAAAALWAQDVSSALEVASRLPQELVWLNALNLLDPLGGCAGGDGSEVGLEALREFARPPWDPPPEKGDPPESPGDEELRVTPDPGVTPDLAAAMVAARRAARGWAGLTGAGRARVLRGAAAALEGGANDDGQLGAVLRMWAERAEMVGGAIQEVPGGRVLVTRAPLGVVGVAWAGPRPLARALELLPPALALGNALLLLAPPTGLGPAHRLRQALVAAGLPGGALAVLPGGGTAGGALLAPHRPDAIWLCGGGTDLPRVPAGPPHPRVWVPGGGVLGGPGSEPPPRAACRELELRCSRPRCLWLPGWGG